MQGTGLTDCFLNPLSRHLALLEVVLPHLVLLAPTDKPLGTGAFQDSPTPDLQLRLVFAVS